MTIDFCVSVASERRDGFDPMCRLGPLEGKGRGYLPQVEIGTVAVRLGSGLGPWP